MFVETQEGRRLKGRRGVEIPSVRRRLGVAACEVGEEVSNFGTFFSENFWTEAA